MPRKHTNKEILSVLEQTPVASVATSGGDKMRNRMMHYAADENFNLYLASMKGDPKMLQITHRPTVSLLIYKSEEDFNNSQEVEINGKAVTLKNQEERQKALEMTAQRSPVVNYLLANGNDDMLDCLKVTPEVVKYRIFNEIVQGMPPTVIEFPENRTTVSDWGLLKTKIRSWIIGLRTPFLTASIVPILLGTAISWAATDTMHWGYFLLTLLAGLLLHSGANVMNDYFDHRSGNDERNNEYVRPFSGGSRVIQLGLLTPVEVLAGGLALFLLAILIGLYLVWARGPVILALGVFGFISAMFYTGRPFKWANKGLGEILIGINFGVLMTLGAFSIQTTKLSWLPVLASLPVALFIIAVVWINEVPDFVADKAVGKKTLVVRLGRQKSIILYQLLVISSFLVILIEVFLKILPPSALLALLVVPITFRAIQYATKHYDSSFDLAPANALTVVSHLTVGLLLTLVYAWDVFGLQNVGYVILLAAIFTTFIVYIHLHVERQKNIFLELKQITT